MADQRSATASTPRHRPYRSASAIFQIGLAPFQIGDWIEVGPDYVAFMAEKRARLAAADTRLFYRTLPDSMPAQIELQEVLIEHLLEHHAAAFQRLDGGGILTRLDGLTHAPSVPGLEPLAFLSRLVEEDLILVEERDGRDVITAASNAYTSSGRIVSSVGRHMDFAHHLVPGLNQTLGPRIDRILANIRQGIPVERFNWMITPIAARLFPEHSHTAMAAASAEVAKRLAGDPGLSPELLWLRVERQTLVRLPRTGARAFSIFTYSDPLGSIAGDRDSLAAIHRLLGELGPERLGYAAMTEIATPVRSWIERITG